MNNIKCLIKTELNNITTDKDITAYAKRRADRAVKASRRYRYAAAALCAVTVMLGTAVSAVNFGWLNDMFGTTAEYSEKVFAQVNVSTDNISFEKFDNAPSDLDFCLLNVVSDGEVIIINYKLSGSLTNDTVHERARYYSKNTLSHSWASWLEPLSDGTYGHMLLPDFGINSGDRIELSFVDDETDSVMGKASFTISEDVPRLVNDIKVGKNAKVRDRSKEYIVEKEFIVDSITVSALALKINYLTKDNSNNYAIGKDIKLVTSDGQTLCLDPIIFSYNTSTDIPKNENGYYKQHISIALRNIIPPENIVSISIGDLTIPIQ